MTCMNLETSVITIGLAGCCLLAVAGVARGEPAPSGAVFRNADQDWEYRCENYSAVVDGRSGGLTSVKIKNEEVLARGDRRAAGGMLYQKQLPFGSNARLCLTAAALAAASRALSRPALLDDAYRMLEWVIGANPYQLSTMTGVGVLQPCALSSQMGNIPGGVTNGIYGDENDNPSYPSNVWFCGDEYYGYNTSQFFRALVAFQDLSW